jgi:3-oxoacyl-[acyl-carrier-protein] synthase III
MLEKYPIDLNELKYFQVNFPSKHISELIMDECDELGISRDTLYTKMSSMGYAGPPMALISIDKIISEEKINPNNLILSFVTEVSKFMQAGYVLKYY